MAPRTTVRGVGWLTAATGDVGKRAPARQPVNVHREQHCGVIVAARGPQVGDEGTLHRRRPDRALGVQGFRDNRGNGGSPRCRMYEHATGNPSFAQTLRGRDPPRVLVVACWLRKLRTRSPVLGAAYWERQRASHDRD